MFVAGKRPTPCKPERGDDTQGNELFLWAWGCCVSLSMHVVSLFSVASTCCSHGHSCTPSGAAGPGVALLSSTMFSCKEGSSWLSPWRKVPQGVGLVESPSVSPLCPQRATVQGYLVLDLLLEVPGSTR